MTKQHKIVARIWESAPDVLDGYFVESIEKLKSADLQLDCDWFPTVQLCEDWARRKNITEIEKL